MHQTSDFGCHERAANYYLLLWRVYSHTETLAGFSFLGAKNNLARFGYYDFDWGFSCISASGSKISWAGSGPTRTVNLAH